MYVAPESKILVMANVVSTSPVVEDTTAGGDPDYLPEVELD